MVGIVLETYLNKSQGITTHDLERIGDSVFNKVSGIRKSLDIMNDMSSKVDDAKLKKILADAESLFRTISVRTLNEIGTMDTYRRHLKKWSENNKNTDSVKYVKDFIIYTEDRLNAKLRSLKMQDAKLRHSKEKTIILGFYQKNKNELKKIFDLQNLMNDAKDILLKNWSD